MKVRRAAVAVGLLALLPGCAGNDDSQSAACVPSHFDSPALGKNPPAAERAWYDQFGQRLGAPANGWKFVGVDGFQDRIVNGRWVLLIAPSGEKPGRQVVTDLLCTEDDS